MNNFKDYLRHRQ